MGSTNMIWTVLLFHSTVFAIRINLVNYTVKKAVELLDVPSRNTSLMLQKYNSYAEIFCLSTRFFPALLSNEKVRQDVDDQVATI